MMMVMMVMMMLMMIRLGDDKDKDDGDDDNLIGESFSHMLMSSRSGPPNRPHQRPGLDLTCSKLFIFDLSNWACDIQALTSLSYARVHGKTFGGASKHHRTSDSCHAVLSLCGDQRPEQSGIISVDTIARCVLHTGFSLPSASVGLWWQCLQRLW